MSILQSFLLIFLLAGMALGDTYKIKKAAMGMVYIVEGDYENNDKTPKITIHAKTGGKIPVEVTLLGDGITQISVKEGPETKHTVVTNIKGYSKGSHVKLMFIAHNEGQMSIVRDQFTKEDTSVIIILLPSVPFFSLGRIVTNNLANVHFNQTLHSQTLGPSG